MNDVFSTTQETATKSIPDIALHTQRGSVSIVQQYVSQLNTSTDTGTVILGSSGKHFFSSGISIGDFLVLYV
eukprot:12194445-Ditylum_brightwellii.AAC.1